MIKILTHVAGMPPEKAFKKATEITEVSTRVMRK